ncbi:xanthine dehydrogenase family protein molybdopterin-binding subunit [Bdellovibrio sp. HCB337]|uniref:xanthine dehydrogenase family protein molybdopterin-binding subunit n=1 Tax=Bdellovibrio sp. HCB337 TaxID=3394358 RepID=UPI0039A5FBDE
MDRMTIEKEKPDSPIGKSVPRKEGPRKLTGQSKYIDDLDFDGLYGTTVRSTIARGKIKNITFGKDIPWDEFTIVTAKDIPGKNYVALILQDQPFLADGVVNHPEEPILLLAHPNKYLLERARQAITIEYDNMAPVFTLEESLKADNVIWGKDNIFKSYLLEKGDINSVWAKADLVIEGEYHTGAQEQLYIENNGMIAIANPKEGVTIWGSMQCPYYVHKALLPLFGLPEEKVRIIQAETGGGFGGKEEYPSIIAGHAALLAWKSGKAVKIIYDRAEDMVATTKRHPSRTRHKTAVTRDGRILGLDIQFVIDGGAYATLSSVVLSRGTIHAAGPYNIEHVRIDAKAVATNSPPHGAFRGFGAPQSIFALERHLDLIAKKLGMTPEEIRRRNFIKDGEKTATGQTINEGVSMQHLLDRALKHTNYHAKRDQFAKDNTHRKVKKGIGFASFMHGSGFTGSGEKYLASKVGIQISKEGRLQVLAASTEIGQGTNTVFSQIAADALNVSPDFVEIFQPDTKHVPNSGPTVASRTTMVVGKLVQSAAIGMRQTLQKDGYLPATYTEMDLQSACKKYVADHGELKIIVEYQQPPGINWNDETYQGDAYGSYAWAIYVAEVSVDLTTWETKVDHFMALQEVGRVIHPLLAAGQIEGGVAQGIGYAIYEKVKWKDGRMINGTMTNYIMPTSSDLPTIEVLFEEVPYAYGPRGAKGIGELPMDGPAPAILNAVSQAIGKDVNAIPMLPEDLMRASL